MKNKHVYTVLEQLPLRKIASYPKNNPNQEAIFLGGNHLVAPQSKTNPDLDANPNPNGGGEAIFFGGNCLDTCIYKVCWKSWCKIIGQCNFGKKLKDHLINLRDYTKFWNWLYLSHQMLLILNLKNLCSEDQTFKAFNPILRGAIVYFWSNSPGTVIKIPLPMKN